MSSPAELLATYLRQREALGVHEFVFQPETAEMLRRAARLRRDGPTIAERAGGSERGAAQPSAEPRRSAEPIRSERQIDETGSRLTGPGADPRRGALAAAAPAPRTGTAAAERSGAGAASTIVPLSVDVFQIGSLDEVRAVATTCTACGLAATRTNVVFADGNPAARVAVVGEAPGADEDRAGLPFVGRAGQLLDRLLLAVGFPRSEVYICNVLKCRPPQNRNPQPEEVAACSGFLRRQLDLVAPEVILAVGSFAAQTLLETTLPIGQLRGKAHDVRGIPVVPTYHPAALLRNRGWIRPVWEDLQRLRAILDG